MLKIFGVLLIFLMLTIFGNCSYNFGSVKNYISKNISESPCVLKYNSKNRWIAYFSDNPDYIFEIWVKKHYTMFNPIPKQFISSNFNNKFSIYYFNEYIKEQDSKLSPWNNDYPLHGNYSTVEEAKNIARDIVKYFEFCSFMYSL